MPKCTKDPDAILDYQINWATWLGTDTIATTAWTLAPTGTGALTKTTDTKTTTTATIWLSGGTANTDYTAACKITTAGGRTDERTLTIYVRQR